MSKRKVPVRDRFMLQGRFAEKGYDWWWHSFTGIEEKTGEEKSFFIEYFTCNPALGNVKPILGQQKDNKEAGVRPSYLMVKAGCRGEGGCQLHRFFGWKEIKVRKKPPFVIRAANCYASEKELRGAIFVNNIEAKMHPEYMCDAGSMSWDLKVDKQISYNVGYGAGAFFRWLKAFEMYWHAEGIKTAYSGTVVCNGKTYKVTPRTCWGYADKNWGSNFTSPWVWLSSCCLKSKKTGKLLENSAFDIGGGCPRVFGIPLRRKLLGCFYYEGKNYEFNFSKFWTGSRTSFSFEETDDEVIWHVRQKTFTAEMDTEARCLKKDMIWINYEAPDGSRKHNKLWNGGNGTAQIKLYSRRLGKNTLIDEIDVTHLGCEYGEYCDPAADEEDEDDE